MIQQPRKVKDDTKGDGDYRRRFLSPLSLGSVTMTLRW